MSRVVLIGNSHLGALARAAKRLRKRGILLGDVAFFAVPSGSYRHVQALGDNRIGLPEPVLAADPSLRGLVTKVNGDTSMVLRDDDICVVVGAPLAPRTIAELVAGTAIDGWRDIEADQLLSQPTFDALVDGILDAVMREHFWRCIDGRPFYLVQGPRAPESVQETPLTETKFHAWRRLPDDPTGINRIYDHIHDRLNQRLKDIGGALITQPKGTLTEAGLTATKFSVGSQRLSDQKHPTNDYMHMNNVYGRLVLRKVLTVIEKRHNLKLLGEATDDGGDDEIPAGN